MNLYYKGVEITPDLYVIEYQEVSLSGVNTVIKFFSGIYSYQKAVIYAHENFINGKIIYCLSMQFQNVVDGFPVKRGKKKTDHKKIKKNKSFTPQILKEPVHMKQIE